MLLLMKLCSAEANRITSLRANSYLQILVSCHKIPMRAECSFHYFQLLSYIYFLNYIKCIFKYAIGHTVMDIYADKFYSYIFENVFVEFFKS